MLHKLIAKYIWKEKYIEIVVYSISIGTNKSRGKFDYQAFKQHKELVQLENI